MQHIFFIKSFYSQYVVQNMIRCLHSGSVATEKLQDHLSRTTQGGFSLFAKSGVFIITDTTLLLWSFCSPCSLFTITRLRIFSLKIAY